MKRFALIMTLLLLLIPTKVFADSNIDKQIKEIKSKIELEQQAVNRYDKVLSFLKKSLESKENKDVVGWLKKSISLVEQSKKDSEDMIIYYKNEIKKLESTK